MAKHAILSPEDLARWRMINADKELVDNAFPGLSVTEARSTILNYYKMLGDILAEYNVPDTSSPMFISPYDGSINIMEPGPFQL